MKKLVFVGLVVLLMHSTCSTVETDPVSGKVKYEVACEPAGFNVTYSNSDGGTSQHDIAENSWTSTIYMNNGDFVSLLAQAENENSTISVKIYYRDELFKSSTSTGNFVVASVSGILE